MPDGLHSHSFNGRTTFNDGHIHEYFGVTSFNPDVPGHVQLYDG